VQSNLGRGLDLPDDPNAYVIFRNLVTGKEYIRNCSEMHVKGLFVELLAYQTCVFLDFKVVFDTPDGRYSRVNAYLGGHPVDSVEEALQEMFLEVIHHPYRELVNAGMLRYLISSRRDDAEELKDQIPLEQVEHKSAHLLRAVAGFLGADPKIEPVAEQMRARADAILDLPVLAERYPYPRSTKYPKLAVRIQEKIGHEIFDWAVLLTAALTQPLGMLRDPDPQKASAHCQIWIDEWLLRKVIRQALLEMPVSESAADYGRNLARLLTGHFSWRRTEASDYLKPRVVMKAWLEDQGIRDFLRVNTFEQIEWFNGEAMDAWLDWMLVVGVVDVLTDPDVSAGQKTKQLVMVYNWITEMEKAAALAEYQVGKLAGELGG